MKTKSKVLLGLSLLAVAILAAFAPPAGVVFSKEGFIYPANPRSASTASAALVAAGSGDFADDATIPTSDGLHILRVNETTGLELHFAISGTLGQNATARVYRALPVRLTQGDIQSAGWTYRHICDVSLTGSAQALGEFGEEVGTDLRWASVLVTSSADGGLSTRAINGTTTNAAGSLFIDPVCAPYIIVQTRIGTCASVAVYASDWTRN